MKKFPFITKTIFLLALISLFTDVASEMLYPVMPLYLSHIGFSVALIGLLEGVAEATAGLSKGYFGYLSDSLKKRKPFVQTGYSLSAVAKPFIGVWTYPWWIFLWRTLERLGKGLRTGARDAMLSDESEPSTKGRVFGFHRAFDTLGAALGPACSLVFLLFYPSQYRILFFLAFFPGVIAILLTFFLKENNDGIAVQKQRLSYNPFSYIRYWKEAPVVYKRLVVGLLAFALVNSSDVFLLLVMKMRGISDTTIIGIYIFYNIIYAATSYPMGVFGDRIGLKRTFLLGLLLFAVVYGGMALAPSSESVYLFLFFLYGVYAASTEGISKAWISNVVQPANVATAIGFYTSFQSVMTFAASSLAGWIWFVAGPPVMFGATAVIVVLIAFSMAITVPLKMEIEK